MITVCLTSYNRTELLYESFKQIIDHPFVTEIVIVDDASKDAQVRDYIFNLTKVSHKIIPYFNARNLDCYFNKREAVSKSRNEWVILFDSDNILTKQYIDRLENLWIAGLNAKTVYQPSFAKPHFDFRKFEGLLIDRSNIGRYFPQPQFSTMLNAMNYFVNRDEYLRVWDGSIDPVTSDSIYQNLNWFKAGNNMYVVPGLEYDHAVHSGSHYQNNVRRTPSGLHERIENEIKALS